MAKLKVEHMTNHAPDKTFSILREFLCEDEDFRRFDPKMKLDFQQNERKIQIKSSKFLAVVDVLPPRGTPNGSFVKIELDLALLLTPFKGKIQETLEKKLTKYLA